MDNIILCPNVARDHGFEMTLRANEIIKSLGRSTVICPLFDDDTAAEIPAGLATSRLEDELVTAEMIITFGGDGTILRAVRAAADLSVPVLGVNMGGKGFMAELEREDIGLIATAASGKYGIDNRMMLDVDLVRDGEIIMSDFALNDVVIGGLNKMIEVTIFGDGQKISHFSGDGTIIATPTGSTAYSMAAGGPIVEPTAHNILVTPVCAHLLEARPFVLVSDRCVTVEIGESKASHAYLSVDGCDSVTIYSGDTVNVRKSSKKACLVQLSGRSFYRKVSEKLGERL